MEEVCRYNPENVIYTEYYNSQLTPSLSDWTLAPSGVLMTHRYSALQEASVLLASNSK